MGEASPGESKRKFRDMQSGAVRFPPDLSSREPGGKEDERVDRLMPGFPIRRLVKPGLVLVVLFTGYFLFTLTLLPPRILTSGHPIAVADYALHFIRTVAANEFWTNYQRSWGYNPFFMAGYPAGTVFDVNNHFIELFGVGLHRFGVSLPTAFNLLVFLAFLLAPFLVWLTARNFGLTPWQQVIAVTLAMALWLTDSQVSLTWRIGVIASGMAMYSLPFSLSCLYRFRTDRSKFWALCFLVSGALVSLLHPLSFLFFYAPIGFYFLWRAKDFDLRFWAVLVVFAGIALLANLFWILPLVRDLPLKTWSGYHWIGNLKSLVADLLGARDSGLRLLIYLLAAGGFLIWSREGQKELFRLLLVLTLVLSFFGYISGQISAFQQLETYRNNLVASFLLIMPASLFITSLPSRLQSLPSRRRWAVAGLALLITLHVIGRNLLWFRPFLSGDFRSHSLRPLGPDEIGVVKWLQGHDENQGRVLVEYWPLADLLPWYAGLQVIGGPYPLVWMPHNFANFVWPADDEGGIRLFGRYLRQMSPPTLDQYLETYNIGWVVAHTEGSKEIFDRATQLLVAANFGPYRIYQNSRSPSFFLNGNGNVRAEFGRLQVTGASPGKLVLKFHWASTLVTDPPQELRPKTVLDDPVPFIEVPQNRFSDFVIRDTSSQHRLRNLLPQAWLNADGEPFQRRSN